MFAAAGCFPVDEIEACVFEKFFYKCEIKESSVLVSAKHKVIEPAPDRSVAVRPIREHGGFVFDVSLDGIFEGRYDQSKSRAPPQSTMALAEQTAQVLHAQVLQQVGSVNTAKGVVLEG